MAIYAISGSWRTTDEQVETDVRTDVRGIVRRGGSIVTGGALGVDYIATDEMMKYDPKCMRIKIILPTKLEVFNDHFRTAAKKEKITADQADMIITQLDAVKKANPHAIEEMSFDVCNPDTYYARNQRVVDKGNILKAYQVNESQGTQDAIDRAKAKIPKMPIHLKKYTIPV